MVVCVEPLLQSERLDVAILSLIASCHSEICADVREAQILISLRNDTEKESRVEHVVVEREVIRRDVRDAGFLLLKKTALPYLFRDGQKFVPADLASEIFLGRELEFPVLAYSGITYN